MLLTVKSMVPQDPAVDVGTYMFSFLVSIFQICRPGFERTDHPIDDHSIVQSGNPIRAFLRRCNPAVTRSVRLVRASQKQSLWRFGSCRK